MTFPFSREVTPVRAEATELLVGLLTAHQQELFRYIFALLPHEEDARDVLQETSVALCRKFDEYDPSQPFLPWAYRFAFLEVLSPCTLNWGTIEKPDETFEVLERKLATVYSLGRY